MDVRPCILIAEDHQDAREMLATLLRGPGYPVVQAKDGDQAIDLFDRHRPQLAILDMMMPGLDGLEACRGIKDIAGEAFVPVMILTALGRHDLKIAGLDGGADDYVTKPFSPPELMARIRSLLRIRRVHEQLLEKDRELLTL